MLKKLQYYMVDVFAERRFSGNQLAVVIQDSLISSDVMQKIAREINFSETVFLQPDKERGEYDVRIFTPKTELPFAGHPLLGAAYIIREQLEGKESGGITLRLPHCSVPLSFQPVEGGADIIWMKQRHPEFGKTFLPSELSGLLSVSGDSTEPGMPDALAISEKQLLNLIDSYSPVQQVSTGLSTLVVPVRNSRVLQSVSVNHERFMEMFRCFQVAAILVYAPVRHAVDTLHVRVFCDPLGIPEDPATGSANGCLCGYLVMHGDEKVNLAVSQGECLGRPSRLYLRGEKTNGLIDVSVGGRVVHIATGCIFIPV